MEHKTTGELVDEAQHKNHNKFKCELIRAEMTRLEDKYGRDIPDDVLAEFYQFVADVVVD